jgi:GAF domain-containing protein
MPRNFLRPRIPGPVVLNLDYPELSFTHLSNASQCYRPAAAMTQKGDIMLNCSAEGYQEILQKTAHALSGVLKESEIIQLLLKEVTSALSLQNALVLLLGREGDRLLPAGSLGLSDGYMAKIPLQLADCPLHQRVMAGELVITADVAADPDFPHPVAAREHLRQLVAVPMSVRDHVIGILHVYLDTDVVLEPAERVLLSAITDLGALALEKVRLQQSLYRIAGSISSSLDLEPVLQRVLEATVEEMWLKAGVIRLFDPKDKILRMVAAYGLSEAYLNKGSVHLNKSKIDRRVLAGEVVVLEDVRHAPEFEYPEAAAREGIFSILAVPLAMKSKILGVMRVHSGRPRHFGPVAINFLRSVADLVGLAIENARLYAELKIRYQDLKLDLADWRRFLALG